MGDIGRCWVDRVRRGARVLFWIVLVSPLVTAIGSLGVTLLTGTRTYERWVVFVPSIGEVLMLISVYALTTAPPCPKEIRVFEGGRQLLRVCAVLTVCGQVARLLAQHIPAWPTMPQVWASERAIESAAIFLVFVYLKTLALRFDQVRLSRSCGVVAWGAALGNLLFVFSLDAMYENLGLSLSTYRILLASRTVFHLVIWMWALQVLWTFGMTLSVATEGRCINCGYPHQGLTEPRCPECGRAFDRPGTVDAPV